MQSFIIAVVIIVVHAQHFCDYAIKFARWQHPAVERVARFAVPGTTLVRVMSL